MNDVSPASTARQQEERAAVVEWVAVWERAGVEFEEHRRGRLAAMTADDMRRSILAIFVSLPGSPPRPTSGMVEMQRLFSRLS